MGPSLLRLEVSLLKPDLMVIDKRFRLNRTFYILTVGVEYPLQITIWRQCSILGKMNKIGISLENYFSYVNLELSRLFIW